MSEKVTFAVAQKIADQPEVDAALRSFHDDATANEAVALVQAILTAAPPPEQAYINNAPHLLNTNDKAMWILGWNECREAWLKEHT